MNKKEQKQLLRTITLDDEEFNDILNKLPEHADTGIIVDMVIRDRNQKFKKAMKKKPQNVALAFFSLSMLFLIITMILNGAR